MSTPPDDVRAEVAGTDLPPIPAESFYEQHGPTTYASTQATQSPWQFDLQHGGPPAALLARSIEGLLGDEPMAIGKLEVDFLGPIPQGLCEIDVEVLRPGRQVRQVQASMRFPDRGPRPAVVARAWLIAVEKGRTSRLPVDDDVPALPGPQPQRLFAGLDPSWGYGRAVEWRFASGGFQEVGAARVWTRVRVPLVADAPTSDLQRLLVVADSTNGVSAALPMEEWLSIPPSLTVGVLRPPTGDWFLLDARTSIEDHGLGLAQSTISDEHGLCAQVLQPLLVAPV